MDMIVDAVLSLWSKCKAVFQRHQTGSAENWKYLNKIENPTKVTTDLYLLRVQYFL